MAAESKTAFVHGGDSLKDGGISVGNIMNPNEHVAHNIPPPTYPHSGTNLGMVPMGPNGDIGDE